METRSPGKRGSVTATEFGKEAENTGESSTAAKADGGSEPSLTEAEVRHQGGRVQSTGRCRRGWRAP